jgi:hypothetical protein
LVNSASTAAGAMFLPVTDTDGNVLGLIQDR